MIPLAHEAHQHGGGLMTVLPPAVLAVLAGGYLLAAARRAREPRGWSRWRTASFVAGVALAAAAVTGPVAAFAGTDFRGHMLQHLLIGMLAPLGLVLGAPVTLLLRSLPPVHGRRVGALLRSRVVHLLAGPWIALLLSVGAPAVFAFTATPTLQGRDGPAGCRAGSRHRSTEIPGSGRIQGPAEAA
ncbi:cytochrome c oxidase assembly protein [Streptosporangium sp. NPDC048865]|uniref:cytochrome c oxidase assembly protein n=1 Tax=Streptosporangium sp. NPDC048865 TaxID=3155766 RepID=UPI003429C6B6